MAQPTFFKKPPASTLADIAALTKAQLVDPSRGGHVITGLASLDGAGPMHLAFFDNLKYADELKATKAGACLGRLELVGIFEVVEECQMHRACPVERSKARDHMATPGGIDQLRLGQRGNVSQR